MSATLKIFKAKPNEKVIEAVKAMLINAEVGDTTGFVLAEQKADGGLSWSTIGIEDRFRTVGFIECVKNKLLED